VYPLYPYSGVDPAGPNMHNVPLRAGSGGKQFRAAMTEVCLPALEAHQPEMLFVSAGFDAHRDDPLAECRLESGSFARIACHIRDLAAGLGTPLGAVLEGGYEPQALAESVAATLAALGGEGEAIEAAPEPLLTSRAAAGVARHWTL
jgi:acetoin utilization deacetylase AcuC-like enzyme